MLPRPADEEGRPGQEELVHGSLGEKPRGRGRPTLDEHALPRAEVRGLEHRRQRKPSSLRIQDSDRKGRPPDAEPRPRPS